MNSNFFFLGAFTPNVGRRDVASASRLVLITQGSTEEGEESLNENEKRNEVTMEIKQTI